MTTRFFLPLTLAISLLASVAFAGDFVVVPGQRIGSVRLGMSRTSVHALLHTPSTTHTAPHGLVLDTWLGHQLLTTDPNGDKGLKHDYLTVFFRRGRAVQIEVSAAKFRTASGLSTRSSADAFTKQYLNYQTPHFAPDETINWDGHHFFEGAFDPAASSPAPKHYVVYGDAVRQGIAWKDGAWGGLAPEPDLSQQEAVIVHVPGQPVLLNPNDGRPYSGTGPARE